MVAALYRMVQMDVGVRDAVAHVNGHCDHILPYSVLTRSTVHRVYSSLPPHLQHHSTCTEAALIDFLQQQQSASRAASTAMRAPSLLTALEEDILVEYSARAHSNNASIGADVIKAQAIRMLRMRDPPVEHDGTSSCTQRSRESASREESRGWLMSVCTR